MIKTTGWIGVSAAALLVVAGIGFTACSSSDSGGGGGAGGAGGSAGAGGTAGNAGTGGTAGSDAGEAGLVGACDNTSDKAATTAGYCPDNASIADITGSCGLGCLGNGDPPSCMKTCLDTKTNSALSAGCSTCYIDLTLCGIHNCASPSACLGDTKSAACLDCLCGGAANSGGVNCYDAFNTCSGLGYNFCADLDAGTWTGYPAPTTPAVCDDGGAPEAGDDADTGDAAAD